MWVIESVIGRLQLRRRDGFWRGNSDGARPSGPERRRDRVRRRWTDGGVNVQLNVYWAPLTRVR